MENQASHMAGYLLFDVLDLLYWATSFKCCAWSQLPFAEGKLEGADVPAKEVRDITDCHGTVLNHYAYDAFGNRTVEEETVENRFGFAGEMLDAVTGQYYLRARFYNPVIARFPSEDTYYGDGLNLYAYCHNNPVRYVDPSGHEGLICSKKYGELKKKEAEGGILSEKEKRQIYEYEQNQKKSNGAGSDSKSGISTIDMSKYTELSNSEVVDILKTRGLDEGAINDLITSFDGPIYKRIGYEGEIFTITESKVGDASGVFVTRGSAGSTPTERINNLALPPNNSALIESQVELTRTQILLEGKVAPQREWALIANDGIPRSGGAWQVVTDGGKYSNAIRR